MLSHLTFIESNATQFPQRLCSKLPCFEVDDNTPHRKIIGWRDITYGKFFQDIKACARHWRKTFGAPEGSVVGLWMFGMTYQEVVHLFALVHAKYVPQLLNLKIRATQTAENHFRQSGTTYVIYAPTAPIEQLGNHFQVHEMVDIEQLPKSHDEATYLETPVEENGDDVLMIYHTSGSTSGRPKLVPFSRKWLDANARNPTPGLPNGKEIGIAINGISHLSQLAISLKQFENGACIVLMPWLEFTVSELLQIITECNVNTLYQLTPILSQTIREAMTNVRLTVALQSLDFIVYGGSIFGDSEREWAMEKGITLKHLFGSTEAGLIMVSKSDPTIFHPFEVPGVIYEFRNVGAETEEPSDKLAELVIPPASLNCPHSSFCNPTDGHYYTRDLFQEVEPNGFKYRGRLDDIIFMDKSQKCDTLYIESQVLLLCKDLISVCVVVGSGRPSPTLIVEPIEERIEDVLSLRNELGKKVEPINKDGFSHERIHSSRILIVSPGALPRTPKGNITRKRTEELFKDEIAALYDN